VASIVWLIFVIVPIYVIVRNSVQSRDAYIEGGPLSPPNELTLEKFEQVLSGGFWTYLINTVIVTVATVALTVGLALPAAYAIVRSRSRLVGSMFRVFLLGLAIPAQACIIPIYLIIIEMNLYDSLTAIVLPTVAFGLPLAVLVLTTVLRDVPRELYESMTLDGAGAARLLWNLAIPMSRAGLVTISIYSALGAWNSFLFPLILTQSEDLRVLTVGLYDFRTQYGIDVPALMAAVLLSALPIFVAYLFARRWLIAGMAGLGGK